VLNVEQIVPCSVTPLRAATISFPDMLVMMKALAAQCRGDCQWPLDFVKKLQII